MKEKFTRDSGNNHKKAIKKDLEDAGITQPSEWRTVLEEVENNSLVNNKEESKEMAEEILESEDSEKKSLNTLLKQSVIENESGRKIDENLPIKSNNKEIESKKEENNENLDRLLSCLRQGDIKEAYEVIKKFKISEEDLKSEKVIEAICKVITASFSRGHSWSALEMVKNFWLPKEKKIELGYQGILSILSINKEFNKTQYSFETSPKKYIEEIKNIFLVPKTMIDEALSKEVIKSLENSKNEDLDKAENIQESFPKLKINFKSPEATKAMKKAVIAILERGYLHQYDGLRKNFKIGEEILESPEVIEAAFACMLKETNKGSLYYLKEVHYKFPIPAEKYKSPEVSDAIYTGMLKTLKSKEDSNIGHDLVSFLEDLKKIKDICVIPEEKLASPEIINLAYEKFKWYLKHGWSEAIMLMQDFFNFPEEKINSPEVDDLGYKAILENLERGDSENAINILKVLPVLMKKIDSEEIKEVSAKGIEYWLNAQNDYVKEAVNIQKNFPLSNQQIGLIAYKYVVKNLRMGDFARARLINKSFSIPEDKLNSEEVVEIVSNKISDYLLSNNLKAALKLATEYKFPQEKINSIAKEAVENLINEGRFFKRGGDENEYEDRGSDYESEESEQLEGKMSIEALVTKFPSLKNFLDTEEIKEKIQKQFVHAASSSTRLRLEKIYERFTINPETILEAFRSVPSTDDNFAKLIYLNSIAENPIDPLLTKTLDIFGDFATIRNYETINSIYQGEIPEEAKLFGVKRGGQAGLTQLEQGFLKFRQEILSPDFDPHILKNSKLAKNYFKSQVRFDQAEWSGDGSSFDSMLGRYIELYDEGEYEMFPLNEKYVPSDIVYIDTVDSKNKSVEYSEQFLSRFKTISEDVKKAKQLFSKNFPISEIISELEKKVANISKEMEDKIKEIPNENGKEALTKKVSQLQELKLRSLKDFESNFAILASIKELESDLRQAMFVMGFAKNRSHLNKNLENIDLQTPKLDDVTWMMNFVDHIVNKEVMSQYFKDKPARNKFRELINIRSFEEELSRFQNQEKVGTKAMKFVPTRGLLMEFSGHIADACWADKYHHTIPATFPNFFSVSMVQNPGTKHERLCGSCLVIETREGKRNGEPLLLIRGMNPIENVINDMSVDDFYKKLITYVSKLANKTGRKPAIVIDDHCGGAASNRPMLFNYLSNLNLDKVRVPYRETEFNGYDVTRDSYLVE